MSRHYVEKERRERRSRKFRLNVRVFLFLTRVYPYILTVFRI